MPPRERGGSHHAWDRAGSRRLPPQRLARALPRPGPHAPTSEELLGGVGGRSAKWRLGRGAEGRSFAVVTEADGDGRRAKVLLLWSGKRDVLWCSVKSGGLGSESGRGPELAGVAGYCPGQAKVRRAWIRVGVLSGASRVPSLTWRAAATLPQLH